MTQHALFHVTFGARAALRCVILLLTLAASENAFAGPRKSFFRRDASVSSNAQSAVYLAVVGPAPLRFASASPALKADNPASVSASSSPRHRDPVPAAEIESPAATPAAQPQVITVVNVAPPPTQDPALEKAPAPIVLDDLRPTVRAEDFLPYFQIPGSSKTTGELVLIVPPPRAAPSAAPIPVSSATYTQTPK